MAGASSNTDNTAFVPSVTKNENRQPLNQLAADFAASSHSVIAVNESAFALKLY
jgi:hypothetical protein